MSELEKAARLVLGAIESGEPLDEVVPMLRAALAKEQAFDTYSKALEEYKKITHLENCWSWGPAHYECARAEIARLRNWSSSV